MIYYNNIIYDIINDVVNNLNIVDIADVNNNSTGINDDNNNVACIDDDDDYGIPYVVTHIVAIQRAFRMYRLRHEVDIEPPQISSSHSSASDYVYV